MRDGVFTRRAALRAGMGALGIGALGAGALAAGVETRVLPGRGRLDHALGLDGTPGRVPTVAGVPVTSGTFASKAMKTTLGYSIARPATAGPVRVAVVLHGRGGDHRGAFDEFGMDRFLAQAIDDGVPPFALASIDGGDSSYYHRRADGTDSGAAILDEFLPLLQRQGLDTGRVAFQGTSMGGYGAILLAARHGAARTAAVGAQGPAIFASAADTAAGAYDSAEDFDANDVMRMTAQLQGIPIRVDIGTDDPFYPTVERFVDAFSPPLEHSYVPGGHDNGVWLRSMGTQVAFIGRHLAA
ncbi:alpha/beta hydrolase [Tsukamurella soli]|uniref:Acyl-CoA:diacylglycerol acyltransferase n=1 Tax=Tsukamurella soli TaxID=644556 RepID=A0ABP8KF40_9ACTN